MSAFNDDQLSYMRSLAAMAPETKCWCAWYPKGKCHTCPRELSAADRIPFECPSCHNWPYPSQRHKTITHRIGCTTPDWQPVIEKKPEPQPLPEGYELFEGKPMKVLDGARSGWWRFHEHYDRDGYCDNPARGY